MHALLLISVPQRALTAALPAFIFLALIAALWHLRRPRYGASVKPSRQRSWLMASLAALSFFSTIYCGRISEDPGVTLEADMRISAGQIVSVYVNDLTIQPRRLPVVSNSRHLYRFEHLPGFLKLVRIDPSNSSDAEVSIYSVAIMSNGRVVRKFGPSELRAWRLYNLTPAAGDPASFNLLSSKDANTMGQYLAADVSVFASERPAWVSDLVDLVQAPDYYSLVFIFCFLLFLLCGLSTVQGAIEASLVAAIALVAYPFAVLVSQIPASPPSVTAAVGKASYVGYPKLNGYWISFVLLSLSVALAWLAFKYLWPRTPQFQDAATDEVAREKTGHWISKLVPPGILLWLLILYCPNLAPILPQLPHASYGPTAWDYQASVFWDYLVHSGYLPYRDFWFPYAGFYVNSLAFPNGQLIAGLQFALTLWFLYLGLQFALARQRRTAVLLFLMVFVPIWIGEFWGWYRYLLSIDIALFYVALQNTNRFEWRKHVPFVFLVALVFFYEPIQLAYAGVGMLAHTLWAAWLSLAGKRGLRAMLLEVLLVLRQRFAYIGIPLLVGIIPPLVFFAAKGMLHGFIRLVLSAPVQAAYGSYAADVVSWTKPFLRIETMFMVLFFVLTLGFLALFTNLQRPASATLVLLVTGLAGFVVMQKHITRPPMLEQVQIFLYLGVLLYVLGMWRRRAIAQSAVVALYLGFIMGVVEYRGFARPLYRSLIGAPAMLAGNFDVMFRRTSEVRAANAAVYDPSKFDRFIAENKVVDTLQNEFGWNSQQAVYVMGDDPVFYILLREKPPYVFSTYNGSPLEEQQHVIKWLQERQPRFIIWNPSKDSFDTVPHTVRLPLIYRFIVDNYRPLKTVEPYQILVAQEHPDSDDRFWRQQLGTRLDLGHVPRLTKSSGYRNCPADNPASCEPILYIRFPGGQPPGKAVLTMQSAWGPYEVAFDVTAGTRECIIDLDRLWFRTFVGIIPRMTFSVPGAEVIHEFRLRKSDVLY